MGRKPPGNIRLVLGHLLVFFSILWGLLMVLIGNTAIGSWYASNRIGDEGAIGIAIAAASAWAVVGGPLLGLALVCYVSSIASSSYFAAAEAWRARLRD